jgi:hypothetical protein
VSAVSIEIVTTTTTTTTTIKTTTAAAAAASKSFGVQQQQMIMLIKEGDVDGLVGDDCTEQNCRVWVNPFDMADKII